MKDVFSRIEALELLCEIEEAFRFRPPREEHRADKRTLSGGTLSIQVLDRKGGFSARCTASSVDISRNGIGFVSPVCLARRDFVVIEYQLPVSETDPPGQNGALRTLAQVRHSADVGLGQWRVGCEFVIAMSSAQGATITAPTPKHQESD